MNNKYIEMLKKYLLPLLLVADIVGTIALVINNRYRVSICNDVIFWNRMAGISTDSHIMELSSLNIQMYVIIIGGIVICTHNPGHIFMN